MSETLVRKRPSIFEEMKAIEDRVMRRAYEIFSANGIPGRDLDNWLQAERELVWRPAAELSEKDGAFKIEFAVPGVEPGDVNIEVTAEDILVKAELAHEHNEKKGQVYFCEFDKGNLFRSIHLPKKINPDKVKADFKNGMLYLTAEIAEEARVKKVKVEAA